MKRNLNLALTATQTGTPFLMLMLMLGAQIMYGCIIKLISQVLMLQDGVCYTYCKGDQCVIRTPVWLKEHVLSSTQPRRTHVKVFLSWNRIRAVGSDLEGDIDL